MQNPRIYSVLILMLLSFVSSAQVGQILWEDNFDSFNPTIWSADTGDGCPDLCGWGNEELQWYQNENVYIEEIPGEPGNFALVLEAKNESAGGKSFTSGKVTSRNNLAVKYGMVEARVKVPNDLSSGLWPAVWMLGTNEAANGWPFSGEIDLMEMGHNTAFRSDQEIPSANENSMVAANLLFYDTEACNDQNQDCVASISFDKYYNQPYHTGGNLTDRFLIYRMYWDENEIRLTVEDQGKVHNFYTGPFPIGSASSEFRKPFYLLMNLAVGGNFTNATTNGQVSADLPGKMLIDYIRVKSWNGRGEVFTPEKIMANAGADQEVSSGENIVLNAAGSYGPITGYSWTLNGAEIATTDQHTLTLPVGTHDIRLTVTDAAGNTRSDEVRITVGNQEIGEVIWEDSFDSFNPDYWNKDIGDGCDEGICGWGNQELQSYQSDNVYIEEIAEEPGNFALVLEAKEETAGQSSFTSGKVTTENKVAIQYGVVEVRMKVPDVQNGLWPAAWLLGINHRSVGWPKAGEIDMMEMGHSTTARSEEGFSGSPNNFVGGNVIWYSGAACGSDNLSCAASIAFDKFYTTPYTPSSAMNDRFMTYRMYWNESFIRLTAVDNGTEYDLYTNPFPIGSEQEAFRKPFYFLMNLAVGGSFTGQLDPSDITAPIPAKMFIDYVKVSKWNGVGEVSFPGGKLTANAGTEVISEDLDQDGFETVTLDGSGSYGNITEYEWSENGVVLSQDAVANLTLSSGIHNVLLRVRDAQGNEASDFVKVDIRELLWQEEFDTFDPNKWTAEIGDGCPDLCGWGNQELQYYTSENVSIEAIPNDPTNNALAIEVKNETSNGYSFTSGRVKSEGKVSVKYGLVETRLKVPDDLSTGLWPAAWLLGANISEVGWPRSGEIDMMEMGHKNQFRIDEELTGATENDVVGGNIIFYSDAACGGNPDCAASIAFDKYYSKPYQGATPLTSRFLTYRMYWDPNQIRLTAVDEGVEFDLYTAPFPLGEDAEEFHKPFFFLMNLAVGGNFTDASSNAQVTADLPGKMLVDYIRVYRWNGYGEVAEGSGIIANAGPDIIVLDEDGDGVETFILDASASAHHSGDIISYEWTLNGQVVATGKNPQLELSRGDYEITLTVTDALGEQSTDQVAVKISNGGLAPAADAGPDQTLEDLDGDDLVIVNLDASNSEESNAPIVSYRWLEEGVELGTGVNLAVELSTGIHVITLEVADTDELIGTDEVVVTIIDPDNTPPVANAGDDIFLDDLDGDDLVAVSLDGSGSSDVDGIIEKYTWWQGQEYLTSGVTLDTTLSTGSYEFQLTVTDDDGVSSSDAVVVVITDPDNAPPVSQPGENVVVIDTDLNGEEVVPLDGTSSTDSDGQIDIYKWIYEGNIISENPSFSYTFNLGTHDVTLEVTDDDGVTDSRVKSVIINQLPIAEAGDEIRVTDDDTSGDQTVALDASSSTDPDGTIVSYQWEYNEAIIGTTAFLEYLFPIGTHLVGLTVTDNYGSTSIDSTVVIVSRLNNQAPIANAGADQTKDDSDNTRNEEFTLDASGSSDDNEILSYVWTINGEVVAEGVNPTITVGVGEHIVTLTVTDNEGLSTTDDVILLVTQSVCVFEWCTGNFIAEVLTNDQNTSITFIPTAAGIGETLCLLYYGTGSGEFPGYPVQPFVPYPLNNVSPGDVVTFYYTYSSAPEQTTLGCPNSFIVGNCEQTINVVEFAVTDELQNPIPAASVEMLGTTKQTDSGGKAVFNNLDAQTNVAYTVAKEGYSTEAGTLTIDGQKTILVSLNTLLTGVSEKLDKSWRFYPNPTRDFIILELDAWEPQTRLEVINSIGEVLHQQEIESDHTRLSWSSLPDGVYYLRVSSVNGSSSKRMVVIR